MNARVVITGLRGGSGKTTVSISLAALLKRRGLRVSTFKKGPDYIDPGWLSKASGGLCYNLDPFLLDSETILSSFLYHSRGADISVVEGNRGIYDGVDIDGTFSTAELAIQLRAPVILVIDCTKITRTVAPIIKGIMEFDRRVSIKAVVLNNIFGKRHEKITTGAIRKYTDAEIIGVLDRLPFNPFPQRHIGVIPTQEYIDPENTIQRLADHAMKGIDLDRILEISRDVEPLGKGSVVSPYKINRSLKARKRVGVVMDRAFQFYYPENIEILRLYGCEVLFIDATRDETLPPIDCLYIGGGFPETNAMVLSSNRTLLGSVKRAAEEGLPIYAECGGLMYLGRKIHYENRDYEMAGVLPIDFRMNRLPVAHGYTTAVVVKENPFYPAWTEIKGHEFHYSEPVVLGDLQFAFKMKRGKGIIDGLDGICYKNVFATYTHVHALGTPQWAEAMLRVMFGRNDGKDEKA